MEGAKKKYLKAEALSAVRKGKLEIAIEKYRAYLTLNPEDDDASEDRARSTKPLKAMKRHMD